MRVVTDSLRISETTGSGGDYGEMASSLLLGGCKPSVARSSKYLRETENPGF